VTGGSPEATGTPQSPGEWSISTLAFPEAFEPPPLPEASDMPVPTPSAIGATRFAHASEAEMARILDFYQVRWEYEPTTFPILWNLDGEVIESFAPDFYLPDLDLFLEMTTLRQRLVRKKNRKLRRLRELYPDIRIKLFYARDFRAMMLKYGRLGLAESLSGTSGQVVPERAAALQPRAAAEPRAAIEPTLALDVAVPAATQPAATQPAATDRSTVASGPRATPRARQRRRRRATGTVTGARAEREAEA
jgi:hypothetical protein